MSFDAVANFAVSSVMVAPTPATTGTSLTVGAGDGALFPAAPFNAVVWPPASEALPTVSEIVRVTAVVGDVFTMDRATATEPATFGPVSIAVGYQIQAGATAKTLIDLETLTLIAANNLGDLDDVFEAQRFMESSGLPVASVVATTNQALSGLLTIDDYTLLATDYALLTGQTDPTENGLWSPAAGAWSRPSVMAAGSAIQGRTCAVVNGTTNGVTQWLLLQSPTVDLFVDTDPQTWMKL